MLKEREPRYRELKARLAGRQSALRTPVPVATSAIADGDESSPSPGPAPVLSGRAIPPRPRKKGRKR